jgi:hypothetical protein
MSAIARCVSEPGVLGCSLLSLFLFVRTFCRPRCACLSDVFFFVADTVSSKPEFLSILLRTHSYHTPTLAFLQTLQALFTSNRVLAAKVRIALSLKLPNAVLRRSPGVRSWLSTFGTRAFWHCWIRKAGQRS